MLLSLQAMCYDSAFEKTVKVELASKVRADIRCVDDELTNTQQKPSAYRMNGLFITRLFTRMCHILHSAAFMSSVI